MPIDEIPSKPVNQTQTVRAPESFETARLIFEPVFKAPKTDVIRITNQKAVHDLLGADFPFPFDETAYDSWFGESEKYWEEGATYGFAMYEKNGNNKGSLIGVCDIHILDDECINFGYWFGQEYWGKGYATEMAAGIKDLCFNTLRLTKMHAYVSAHNQRSAGVLQKTGFKRVRTIRGGAKRGDGTAVDTWIYELENDRWNETTNRRIYSSE